MLHRGLNLDCYYKRAIVPIPTKSNLNIVMSLILNKCKTSIEEFL